MSKQRSWVPPPAEPSEPAEVAATEFEPADLARRFGALVVDWLLCLLLSGLFVDTHRTWWVPNLVLALEYTFFVGLFTQTPGMFVTGIRCVSLVGGGRIGIVRAALRGFGLALLVPGIPYGSERRGLNDRLANSMMVPARRKSAA